MDVLSDILRAMRVDGSVYFCDHLGSPWSLNFKDTTSASFHLVRRGECWVVSGDEAQRLGPGDLAFIEPARDHVLTSQLPGQDPPENEIRTLLLCGYCNFTPATDWPLLGDLPSLTIVREEELLKSPWLKNTLDQLSTEYLSQQPGSELVVNKLTEVVLVELIRINFGRGDENRIMRALSDSRIANALQHLHNDLKHAWTLETMGHAVGMSRAAFAKKFTSLVGVPMFEYMTRLRMQHAKELLRDTKLPLFEIASRVGYGSDLAFAKTFNKHTGTTPTRFRVHSGGQNLAITGNVSRGPDKDHH